MKVQNAYMMMIGDTSSLVLEAPKLDILAFLERFEGKYPTDVEISVKRKKRSLDANAYCWVLADMIADAISNTKENVYKHHIREVGVFDDVAVKDNAFESFAERWNSRGIGWFVETIASREKYVVVRCYYGSSVYDTKQMARLIDDLIYEAKELGLETMTPDEIERMKQAWNTK